MFHQFFDIGFGVGESHWTLKKVLCFCHSYPFYLYKQVDIAPKLMSLQLLL